MTDICPPEARPNDAFGLFTPTRYSSTDSTPSGMTEMSAPSPPTILSVTSIPSNVKVFWSSIAPATRIPTLGKAPVPGVTPGTGAFPRVGMRVAGAIDDPNTFTLDGIDVTDNIVGGLGADISVIPLGVE